MDKNAIKKYATWARRELIARVSQKAEQYGITEQTPGELHAESVGGRLLSETEQTQRDALILLVRRDGYRQVMEEVAFTWFNRFCALRFMEVNGYLPTRIRVFTDENNAFKPQILAEAIHMEMDGLDMDKVYQLKSDNKTEELYKYLLVTQCNALSSILPGMFQRIADYTELLLPDNLLREGSVIEQMIALIPEGDWTDQVQIIGWLYQYYNTEPKDQVFADLKKNIKISKEKIPAATQLFTPDWIVRYMVENSLGRLWLEGHPDNALKSGWKYYLDEAEQEPEVQAQLAKIREGYAALTPEDIKCIDPCMGSGHILAYMFDVLVQIYQAYGYSTREAVQSIVEKNLYGLDIDDRAAQLAYFAVMMKARQYDRRFFTRGIQPHVAAVQESESMPEAGWGCFGPEEDIARRVYAAFVDAKEYGSLIEPNVTLEELDALEEVLVQKRMDLDMAAQTEWMTVCNVLWPLVRQARMLVQKYDVVVTNPPYMGNNGMGQTVLDFVRNFYPDSKGDLFAVFIERCVKMTKKKGVSAMITQHGWMFLASYENLRKKIHKMRMVNMAHLGSRAFDEISGEVVQTTSFVFSPYKVVRYSGKYVCLLAANTESQKEAIFLSGRNQHVCAQETFSFIQGTPYTAYWASESVFAAFKKEKLVGDASEPRVGMATANNDRFVRLWHEVSIDNIGLTCSSRDEAKQSGRRWFPFAKGGEQRKWYGNNDTVVNWENDGFEIQNFRDEETGRIRSHNYNLDYIFQSAITWTVIGTERTSFRLCPVGFLYSNSGYGMFCDDDVLKCYLLGFMNSEVVVALLQILSPSMGFESGYLRKLPLIVGNEKEEIADKVASCVDVAKEDWDSFEISWDFVEHPFIRWSRGLWEATNIAATMQYFYGYKQEVSCPLELCFMLWQGECNKRFKQLKANEEELNRIFIDIYGLQDELTPEVEDKDVTIRKADLGRDIRSFISYAVGCMFGRYSLDVPGLVYAGGDWNESFLLDPVVPDPRYNDNETVMTLDGYYVKSRENQFVPCTFPPDKDNILPICDDEYFEDDIVGRFVRFVEVVYGKDTLEENLAFIADALGGKGSPRDVIRSYFLNDFYADHLKTYQKRPIYWLFDSGKKNGFKCLIYMHRYAPDTIARIRTDYVHEQQSRYRTAIADLENRIAGAATGERVRLTKQLNKLQAQAEEIRLYEEKIHHLADQMIAIDLDDGVKVNYAKFVDVLAKIK